jgi:hypothetical protein
MPPDLPLSEWVRLTLAALDVLEQPANHLRPAIPTDGESPEVRLALLCADDPLSPYCTGGGEA